MAAEDTPVSGERRLHPGWFALTLLIAVYGTSSLIGMLWSIGDGAWWNAALAVPAVLFYGWILAGSWRRARTRGRLVLPS